MKKIAFLLFCFQSLFTFSCSSQTANVGSAGIMFYNVENLYDTVDDPATDDAEFLPGSEHQWTPERYQKKLEHIAQVIATGGNSMPVLVGMSEIENETVVKDLIAQPALQPGNFGIIHFDSPDERGIDVALIYNKNIFTPEKYYPIHVTLPGDSIDYTRDILYVSGNIIINGKTQSLNIFVNHWPSRSEGEEVSMPKRAAAASVLKHAVDSLNAAVKDANIIIMGDFNDTPYDKSINQVLGAVDSGDGALNDLMAQKQKNGEGSYNYKGNWQALDQFIVSAPLLDHKKMDVNVGSVEFVKRDWMLYHNEKYGDSPNRTYAGPKYIGGYSDHLPIYIELIIN